MLLPRSSIHGRELSYAEPNRHESFDAGCKHMHTTLHCNSCPLDLLATFSKFASQTANLCLVPVRDPVAVAVSPSVQHTSDFLTAGLLVKVLGSRSSFT